MESLNQQLKKASEMSNCMLKTIFLVEYKSINGLHKGLITQGKYNKLVYIPISSLIPKFLYIRTDTEIMIAYGKPDK
jgi:hypothetical protein